MVMVGGLKKVGSGMQLLLATGAAAVALVWLTARTGDFTALWLTPDQQARRAYEALEFQAAFERFEDPSWKGVAAYRSGLYADSAAAFGRLNKYPIFYLIFNTLWHCGITLTSSRCSSP